MSSLEDLLLSLYSPGTFVITRVASLVELPRKREVLVRVLVATT